MNAASSGSGALFSVTHVPPSTVGSGAPAVEALAGELLELRFRPMMEINPPIANPDAARGYLPSSNPGWVNVTPFTLLSASQFWLPGPPALTSETYARDYNEVKSVGGKVSTVRTADQTQIARFWFEGPGNWNTIARTVVTARGLNQVAALGLEVDQPVDERGVAGVGQRAVNDQ